MNFSSPQSERLFATSVSFSESARVIYQHKDFELWHPFYVLDCYALELSIKACLAQRGASDDYLRHKIGHRLLKGFDEMVEKGFKPPNEDIQSLIQVLSPLHEKHEIRYMIGDGFDAPEHEFIVSALDQYFMAVAEQFFQL